MTTKQKNKSNKNQYIPPLHVKTFDSHIIQEDASQKPSYVPRYLIGNSSLNSPQNSSDSSQFSFLIFGDTTCHKSIPSPSKVPELPVIRASLNRKQTNSYTRPGSKSSLSRRKDSINLNVCYFGESLNQVGCFQESFPVKIPHKYRKPLKPLWQSLTIQPFSPYHSRNSETNEFINTTPRRNYNDI